MRGWARGEGRGGNGRRGTSEKVSGCSRYEGSRNLGYRSRSTLQPVVGFPRLGKRRHGCTKDLQVLGRNPTPRTDVPSCSLRPMEALLWMVRGFHESSRAVADRFCYGRRLLTSHRIQISRGGITYSLDSCIARKGTERALTNQSNARTIALTLALTPNPYDQSASPRLTKG